ncbi:NADH-quinone oxidoreductase subunit C [Geothrix sp.]|jgi:NADH-quinone oxidoreductase subunit C|uniref:NADH-quinone oxidoreductase subunit C n=1 Tax=Geothrix sp. TaxID=1962974 RepID=UPI0025BF2C38|nr:NADH-quinone oxidoreductase subunit C [Geothrix sp.]
MIIEHIDAQLPGTVTDRHAFRGDQTIVVAKENLLPLVDLLHREGFQLLVDITAVDWPERAEAQGLARFDVVYHWLNLASQERLRVKLPVADGETVPSLTSRFKTADWFEREIFDLFGIGFEGHPNLKRLLTWDDFPGHALRKDFPLDGGDPFCMEGCTAPYNNGERA